MPWILDGIEQSPRTLYDSQGNEVDFSALGAVVASKVYVPKFHTSLTNINLAAEPTRTVMFDTGAGVEGALQAVSVNFTNRNVRFVLEIDGVEELAISVRELGETGNYNMQQFSSVGEFPMRIGTDTNHFILDFKGSLTGFGDRMRILGSSITGSRNMDSIIVLWRERV